MGTYLSNHFRSKCISQKVLCQTLAGNEVPLLTITSPSCVADTKNKQGELGRVSWGRVSWAGAVQCTGQ